MIGSGVVMKSYFQWTLWTLLWDCGCIGQCIDGNLKAVVRCSAHTPKPQIWNQAIWDHPGLHK